MTAGILTLNAGSSSIKFAVFACAGDQPQLRVKGLMERMGHVPRLVLKDPEGTPLFEQEYEALEGKINATTAIGLIWDQLRPHLRELRIVGVGHRVVHGGDTQEPALPLDAPLLEKLRALVPLVPLHQPGNLAAIAAAQAHLPDVLQVACFDTSFHQGRDPITQCFAIPRKYLDEGVVRYGFHGISYAYIYQQLVRESAAKAAQKTVIAHLGSGCSMVALDNGRCVDTSMGFSALDGLPMGTRPGALDAGVLLYLMREHALDVDQLETLLYRESGLQGLSGVSNDLRELHASDSPHAAEALAYFAYRVSQMVAMLSASLGGIERLIFTAGVGENDATMRQQIGERCRWLGVDIDPEANAQGQGTISRVGSAVEVRVIPTNEERMIATYTAALL